jgi:hypothetical protein
MSAATQHAKLLAMTSSKTIGCLLIALLTLLLVPSSASAQDVPITEQAKLHFGVGVGLLEDPAGPWYGEAYESFRRAYKASPSPKILSNLGLCAMHIERDGEAIEAYELYLKQVDSIAPEERARIDVDLKRLRASSATLVLSVQPAGALIIDERIPQSGDSVINRYQFADSTIQLRVRSGQHKIRIEAEGHKPQILAAELSPGDNHVQKIKLVEIKKKKKKKKKKETKDPVSKPDPQPDPTPAPDRPIVDEGGGISGVSIAMITITGALTVGAVVVGVLALQHQADYAAYENGGKREEAEAIRSNGEALNITTDVLIALAAASAAVTVVLLVTTSGEESASLSVSPTVGGGTVGLDIRF